MSIITNKRARLIICLIMIITYVPYIFLMEGLVPDSVHLAGFFIIISSIIIYNLENTLIKTKEINIKGINVASIILTFIGAIFLSIIRIFNSPVCHKEILSDLYPNIIAFFVPFWTYIIFIPTTLVAFFILIRFIVQSNLELNFFSNVLKSNNGESSKKEFLFCYISIISMSFMFLFSTYPGIWLKDDVSTVLKMAFYKVWDHWHTLGYLLFVRILTLGIRPFNVNLIQAFIWLFIQFYILYRLKNTKKSMILYTILSLLIFTPYNYLEVMIKDTVYSMGILCLSAFIYFIIRNKKFYILDVLAGLIGVLMISLFRHGGVIVAGASLIILLLYFFITNDVQNKLAIVISLLVISILSYCIINITVSDMLGAEKNPLYVKYTTPIQMISAAAHNGYDFTDEDLIELEKFMPTDDLGELYDPYWSDYVARIWWNPNVDKLDSLIKTDNYGSKMLKLNAKILLKKPLMYLEALSNIDSIIIEAARPMDLGDSWIGSVGEVPKDDNIIYSGLYVYTDWISKITDNVPVLVPFYTRGGLYLIGAFISIACYIIGKRKRYIIALAPALLNTGLLLLACPAQDPRYILPIIEVMIFIIATIPFSLGELNNNY